MIDSKKVVDAALALSPQDVDALEVLLARRDHAIKANPALQDDLELDPAYATETMGIESLKAHARSLVNLWNKNLYDLACAAGTSESKERKDLLDALRVGDAAVIGAVVAALLAMNLAAPLAAVLAPILVKRFIMPAKDELCAAWGESIKGA